ncbi:MAG: histidine phosphatase family protein [Burkholderiaceae bacterium]
MKQSASALARCARLAACAWLACVGLAYADDAALLAELRQGGVAILMRHAQTTPGVGDPPGWRLADCASQRNLDESGVAHAKRIGKWFTEKKLRPAKVRHSPWCRTRDTAQLAFGRSSAWPALANIFEDRLSADAQAAEVRRFIATLRRGELVVLVSHGSTIRHIVDVSLAPGEGVVVRGDASRPAGAVAPLTVLGRLEVK